MVYSHNTQQSPDNLDTLDTLDTLGSLGMEGNEYSNQREAYYSNIWILNSRHPYQLQYLPTGTNRSIHR